MQRTARGFVVAAAFLAVTGNAFGEMITITSPDDLTNLSVGQVFQIDVALQGVDEGNTFLFVLGTSIQFDGGLFEPVPDGNWTSGLTPGAILVTANQQASFDATSALTDGAAAGYFSDLNPPVSQAISQNGIFYSFALRATAPGASSIAIDPTRSVWASALTSFGLAEIPTGTDLLVNVHAVPLPPTFLLAVSGLACAAAWLRIGRHRICPSGA